MPESGERERGAGGAAAPGIVIRPAEDGDLPGLLEIYNEVIAFSTAVFSEEPVTLDERRRWLEARREHGYPVLVAVDATGVAGFGSFGDFRGWAGYRFTVEHTVHVRVDRRGEGIGAAIVAELIARATALGKHLMVAGVEAGNTASLRLHQRLGFEQVALMREVAWKFERWLDLIFLARPLP
jgi:L-amino acid N-acyltransferase YncA